MCRGCHGDNVYTVGVICEDMAIWCIGIGTQDYRNTNEEGEIISLKEEFFLIEVEWGSIKFNIQKKLILEKFQNFVG